MELKPELRFFFLSCLKALCQEIMNRTYGCRIERCLLFKCPCFLETEIKLVSALCLRYRQLHNFLHAKASFAHRHLGLHLILLKLLLLWNWAASLKIISI